MFRLVKNFAKNGRRYLDTVAKETKAKSADFKYGF